VAIVGDPVGSSHALHILGGNITGISIDPGIEFYGKRLQILKEAAPSAKTVTDLGLRSEWNGAVRQTTRDAALGLRISVISLAPPAANPALLRNAFAEVTRQRIDGLIITNAGGFLHIGS
jgi:putative ABC transport system substrate-binding protein